MPLEKNTRLGPYEILAPIGAGGMGEVYRARDSKLGRDVALKVLPDAFARDTDRMARFQREAKVLASLNHTNIAAIHGLEDSGKTHALVMELVEGPTLADRIRLGPIPMDEALQIAKQIADALEYAHEHGIVHRDLKPANIKVTNDDAVKILDFGLAKAIEGDAASADLANSPTMSRMATMAGVLLGTAAYMSPEQAKGKPVDRRADIWAFGCVLYEMLTGKMAFRGETVTDTLAAVIKEEPDWTQLPAATPVRIRVLLQRCLQKDPKQRLRDIGDARISLEEVLSGAQDPASVAPTAKPARRWLLWIVGGVAGVFVVATALLAFLYFRQKPSATQSMRFEIPLPDKTTFTGGAPSVSPDGHKVAFILTGADGQSRLWIRSLDTLEVRPLEGTEGANGWPFWSPDSSSLAFQLRDKLLKVDISGGPPQVLCESSTVVVLGGTWLPDHRILFSSTGQLMQVADWGGVASRIGPTGTAAFPTLLPDGHHFLYAVGPPGVANSGIYIGSLDAKPGDPPPKKLLPDTSAVVLAPSPDRNLEDMLFLRGSTTGGSKGTLMAVPFDPRQLALAGEPIPIAEQVTSFSATPTGVLVYWSGSTVTAGPSRGNIQGQLTWFDRTGKVLGAIGDPGLYRTLAISPDGKRIAFERADPENFTHHDIWLYDSVRGVTTRFTFYSGWDGNPVWSPDGSHIAFGGEKPDTGIFNLYQKTSDLAGEEELLFKSEVHKIPSSWSPDGRFLLFFNPTGATHVWVLPLDGTAANRKPFQLEQSAFMQAVGRFSPDGHWIAYDSNESGKDEIYVRPFDAAFAAGPSSSTMITGKWMVSKDGGTVPLWRGDGKELFYLSPNGMAMAIDVNTAGLFQAGIPKPLFKVPSGVVYWDVTSDGKRFLMPAASVSSASAPFTVVLNWQAGLKK
jgi:serine/threonine protein kinase/Tol biopolymer transport system component